MKKEQFIEIMTELVSIKEDMDSVNKAFRKLDPDFNFFSLGRAETLIVKTLALSVGDTEKDSWISYWLYENDCGKGTCLVTEKDGTNVPIKTIEDLWNIITK